MQQDLLRYLYQVSLKASHRWQDSGDVIIEQTFGVISQLTYLLLTCHPDVTSIYHQLNHSFRILKSQLMHTLPLNMRADIHRIQSIMERANLVMVPFTD